VEHRQALDVFLLQLEPTRLAGVDIWSSTRRNTREPWATPQRVEGDVNTAGIENTPVLSWDGRTLFFASDRTGVNGQIFFSTRHEGGRK
jgi:Tol biopolymer transport system component